MTVITTTSCQMRLSAVGITRHEDAKSRLVIKGYADPDSHLLQTSTPTPENVDINMVLCVLSSMHWPATVGDIKAAFNQSLPGLREQAVYIKLPKLGLPPRYPGATMAELVRELYGLQSGPIAALRGD
eukprot:165499-Amphidinium_carterae.1